MNYMPICQKYRYFTYKRLFTVLTVLAFTLTWTAIHLLHSKFLQLGSTDDCQGYKCKSPNLSHHLLYLDEEPLLNFKNFHYIITNPICKNNLYLVILVHSAALHFHQRDVLRQTWGQKSVSGLQIRIVFLLAKVEDKSIQRIIELESENSGDIVQGNFIDAYRNLTYKHVMGLRWVSKYCQNARFVLKADDDIYVDIFQLITILQRRFPNETVIPENALYCYIQKNMPVVRDVTSKWHVSKTEYPLETFENYCSGWAYIMTPKVAGKLEKISSDYPYFWVDDVHVTGTLAKKVNISHKRWNEWFTIETDGLVEWARSKEMLLWKHVFGPTWGDMELMTLAYEKAKKCRELSCQCCFRSQLFQEIVISTPARQRTGVAEVVRIAVG